MECCGERKIEEPRENPLKQGLKRGANKLKSTSFLEFPLFLPAGNDVDALNATACQSTDPTVLPVGTVSALFP